MLQIIPDFPDHVLGVVGTGEITAEDYRTVLVLAVTARLKKRRHLDLYYQIGPGFTAMSAGAMWQDAKLGIAHWNGWGRIAVVTDVEWIKNSVRLFMPLFHNPVQLFANRDAAEARAWIAAAESDAA